jgi:hypothetical protein
VLGDISTYILEEVGLYPIFCRFKSVFQIIATHIKLSIAIRLR